jgi:hypothetical protein
MEVCLFYVCCQVEVSATRWSLVQRSPTDCGASLCVIKKPRVPRRSEAAEPEKIINNNKLFVQRILCLKCYNNCGNGHNFPAEISAHL